MPNFLSLLSANICKNLEDTNLPHARIQGTVISNLGMQVEYLSISYM